MDTDVPTPTTAIRLANNVPRTGDTPAAVPRSGTPPLPTPTTEPQHVWCPMYRRLHRLQCCIHHTRWHHPYFHHSFRPINSFSGSSSPFVNGRIRSGFFYIFNFPARHLPFSYPLIRTIVSSSDFLQIRSGARVKETF